MNENDLTVVYQQQYTWCPFCGHRQYYAGEKGVDTIVPTRLEYSVHLEWVCNDCGRHILMILD